MVNYKKGRNYVRVVRTHTTCMLDGLFLEIRKG